MLSYVFFSSALEIDVQEEGCLITPICFAYKGKQQTLLNLSLLILWVDFDLIVFDTSNLGTDVQMLNFIMCNLLGFYVRPYFLSRNILIFISFLN